MGRQENIILEKMQDVIEELEDLVPEERGDLARYYRVLITEQEKVLAYFFTYIIKR